MATVLINIIWLGQSQKNFQHFQLIRFKETQTVIADIEEEVDRSKIICWIQIVLLTCRLLRACLGLFDFTLDVTSVRRVVTAI